MNEGIYMSVNYADIGKRIRQERRSKKITQERLSEAAGITVQHMSNIENGNTRLSLTVLVDIANALNTDISVFLVGSLNNNTQSSDFLLADLLAECTNEERLIIIDTLQSLKKSLIANRTEV